MTTPPVTKRRLAGLAAIAIVAAIAMVFVLSTRADAQATTTSVSVSPANAVVQAGGSHAMGVTVSPIQSGVQVRYRILSGPNASETGALNTNAQGLAIFSYNGDEGVGTDAILIWADLDRDGVRDSSEPLTAAIVEWVGVAGTGFDLAPATAIGPTGSSHSVTATLVPAQSGVIVRFRVLSGPNVNRNTVAVTNAAGQAVFSYSGTGGLGTDTIIAWPDFDADGIRDGNEPQATSTRVWTTAGTAGVVVEPATAQKDVNDQHTVHATLLSGESGLFMRFEVTSGPNAGKRGVALTAGGRGTFTYVGRADGIDVITAWVDFDQDTLLDSNEPRGQATVNWGDATPTTSIVATPQTDTNPLGTVHTVRATISPVEAGTVVRFRVNSGPHVGANRRALTNNLGQATYSYQGSRAGTDSITVWVDRDDDGQLDASEPRAVVSKVWTSTTPAQSISLLPFDNVALVGTTHSVTATVSPVRSGAIVRFLVSMGPNRGDSGVGVTNSQGQATFSYVGNGGIGNDAIITWLDLNNNGVREASEPQASAVQRWVSTQVSGISVAPQSSSGQVNTQHTVSAQVSPAANGVLVRFRVTQGPNLGDQGSAFTNASGHASFTYFGNGGVGSDLVLVWADFDGDNVVDGNEPQAAAIRTWTQVAGSGFSLSPANDTNPVNTRHSMTATVAPAQRNLLVRFEVTAGPNEGTRGSDETNSSGRADLSYVGDEGIGTDVILAWVDFDRDGRLDAGEPQAVATKQWTQPVVTSLVLSPSSDTNPVNTRHSFTGTVSPAQRDLKVRFEVTAGPNEGTKGSDSTNSNGRADLSYVGDEGVGTDVILAWIDLDRDGRLDAGEPQAIATKQWTQAAPRTLVVSPSSDPNPVNTRHSFTGTVSPAERNLKVRFEVTAGPNEGTKGSDNTNSNGRADLSYVGDEGPGTDVILVWIDLDRDGRLDSGEPQSIATKVWVAPTVSGLTLSPAVDEEPVGDNQKVTAQLTPQLKGVLIRFSVISGPNEGERDRHRTDSKGRATDTYRGDGGIGTDVVLAWADLDEDGVLDPGEPQATALVDWTGDQDDRARAREICDNLDRYTHPSLPTLCGLLESGNLSDHSEGVIIGVILKNAEKSVHHSDRDRDDDDDDDDEDEDDD